MANLITFSRMAFVVPIGLAMEMGKMKLALILFVVAALTDWLDGYVARKTNTITETGKVMDQMADKVLITSVMVFLVQMGKISPWLVFLIIWRDVMVSAVRILAAKKGEIIAANIFGKVKTVSQMILVIWILAEGILPQGMVNTILVWVVAISTLLSGFVYLHSNRGVFRI